MESTPDTPMIRSKRLALAFKLGVSSLLLAVTATALVERPSLMDPIHNHAAVVLFWTIVVAITELLPVPVTQLLRLSMSFPLLLAVGILYSPMTAALVSFVGGIDPREPRREVTPSTALYNHAQIAFAFFCGAEAFHATASVTGSLTRVVPAILLATATTYFVNVVFVLCFMRVVHRKTLREVLSQLRVGALSEFLLSYLGLGFVGLVIARLAQAVGVFAVFAFIVPLVFARQMFFRSMALEEAGKELKDRERVLRALSNRMAEERQDERMQIAAYLHDDLAQQLFRLTLQTEMAKKRLVRGDVDAAIRDLDGILTTKQETSDMVRALIRDLHRSPIGRKGLGEAIQSFAEDMSRGTPTEITADVVEVALPPPIQLLIYQIAREATMNALKHGAPEHVWLALTETEDGVALSIRDDGAGFDTSQPQPDGHFGSVMMKERALVAGGTYERTSAIGAGTTVRATFPRVWVEEGAALESQAGSDADDPASRPAVSPPTGSTVGPLSPSASKELVTRRGSRHDHRSEADELADEPDETGEERNAEPLLARAKALVPAFGRVRARRQLLSRRAEPA